MDRILWPLSPQTFLPCTWYDYSYSLYKSSFTFTVAELQLIYMFSSPRTLKDDVRLMQTLSLVIK